MYYNADRSIGSFPKKAPNTYIQCNFQQFSNDWISNIFPVNYMVGN